MITNDKLVLELKNRLPDFYGEYLYDHAFIEELFDAYAAAINVVNRHAQYIANNTSISTAEIFKPSSIRPLRLKDSLYDVLDVADMFDEKHQSEGIRWFDNATSVFKKVEFLDSMGLYEVITDVNSADTNEFVIGFNIRKDFSGLAGNYAPLEDYVYRNYKLYLFNQLAKVPHNRSSRVVLLEDIKANDHKLDHQWGIFFPTIYSMFLTRNEYRDMLAVMLKYDSSISSVNEIMRSINVPTSATIRDKYSRKNIPRSLLNKFDKDLGPFDFVFKLPSSYINAIQYGSDQYRNASINIDDYGPKDINYLYHSTEQASIDTNTGRIINVFNFINMIKPKHTNFLLEGTLQISDLFTFSDIINIESLRNKMKIYDSWSNEAIYGFIDYGSVTYRGIGIYDEPAVTTKLYVPDICVADEDDVKLASAVGIASTSSIDTDVRLTITPQWHFIGANFPAYI